MHYQSNQIKNDLEAGWQITQTNNDDDDDSNNDDDAY